MVKVVQAEPCGVSPLEQMRHDVANGRANAASIAEDCLSRANANASRNTYLWLDPERLRSEAALLDNRYRDCEERPCLYGAPVSLKDCFDVAGTPTSAGTCFYAERNGIQQKDSRIAKRIRRAGALLVGKSHLHPLAYGITGENPEFGDCLQPRNARLLTGGSSSGAAASVQEGSALIGIGTDTGGSIRVPAALCGLCGFRASRQFELREAQGSRGDGLWSGGMHLAPSFDTVGLFVQDARDLAAAADGLLGTGVRASGRTRLGYVTGELLDDADPHVAESMEFWRDALATTDTELVPFRAVDWERAPEIFAGIQAHEAAGLHAGHFDAFEPAIRDRLHWGAGLSEPYIASLRARMRAFQAVLYELFRGYDLLMLPCAPVDELPAGTDLRGVRARVLRYTTPFSLGGLPVVTLPAEMIGGPPGCGAQFAAGPGQDAMLLGWAARIGSSIKRTNPQPTR